MEQKHPNRKEESNPIKKEGKTAALSKGRRQEPNRGVYDIYGHGIRSNIEYDYDSQSEAEIWQCVVGCPVRILNEQSPVYRARGSKIFHEGYEGESTVKFIRGVSHPQNQYTDFGGAARFFYCAKPSPAERKVGLAKLDLEYNPHITVKPIELMRWLVRLVTPRNGTVLDPFLGSGTTAIAAENEGCDWLGCDNDEKYCKIAEARIEALGGTQTLIKEFLE